jgi:hypothetical protein
MYTNIPIREVESIVKNIVEKNTAMEEKKEILDPLNVIIEQNYVQDNGQCINKTMG